MNTTTASQSCFFVIQWNDIQLADAAAFPVTNDNDLTTSSTVKAYDDFTTTTTAGQQQLQVQSEDDLTDLEQSLLISLLMIIVSEIGDKTFLIAAIMAMKHSRFVVFSAAFSSLVLMSVLSAFLGHVVPNLIPKAYTDVLTAILFFSFGIRMLWEGSHMSPDDENEEMTEVEEELREAEEGQHHTVKKMEVGGLEIEPEEEHRSRKSKTRQLKEGLMNLMQLVFSPVFVQTFVLTFLGEWGDRSQISTIALAAANVGKEREKKKESLVEKLKCSFALERLLGDNWCHCRPHHVHSIGCHRWTYVGRQDLCSYSYLVRSYSLSRFWHLLYLSCIPRTVRVDLNAFPLCIVAFYSSLFAVHKVGSWPFQVETKVL